MKNWKTTISGVLATIGQALQTIENPTAKAIGQILTAVGFLLLGSTAKDYDVSGKA